MFKKAAICIHIFSSISPAFLQLTNKLVLKIGKVCWMKKLGCSFKMLN